MQCPVKGCKNASLQADDLFCPCFKGIDLSQYGWASGSSEPAHPEVAQVTAPHDCATVDATANEAGAKSDGGNAAKAAKPADAPEVDLHSNSETQRKEEDAVAPIDTAIGAHAPAAGCGETHETDEVDSAKSQYSMELRAPGVKCRNCNAPGDKLSDGMCGECFAITKIHGLRDDFIVVRAPDVVVRSNVGILHERNEDYALADVLEIGGERIILLALADGHLEDRQRMRKGIRIWRVAQAPRIEGRCCLEGRHA